MLKLRRVSQKAWSDQKPSAPWSYTYGLLIHRMNPMREEELERLMPKSGAPKCDFEEARNQYFYLPPLERGSGFVALLFLRCNLESSDDDICFQVVFYRYLEKEKEDRRLQSYGFRFEGPHVDEGGRHQFYHAQLMTSLRKGSKTEKLQCPRWIHEHIPAFPLTAAGPVSLLLCVLGSLYGPGEFQDYITLEGIDRECIERISHLLVGRDSRRS